MQKAKKKTVILQSCFYLKNSLTVIMYTKFHQILRLYKAFENC